MGTQVYRVYSMTRVNMGKQDIQGYTRYTVLLGYIWVNGIHKGIQDIQY